MPGYFVLWWLRQRSTCGSGRAREAGDAVDGTGFAGVRGHARSHKACASFQILNNAALLRVPLRKRHHMPPSTSA
ncbi:hypothetical protein D3C75_755770 [compost metagenome]